MRATTINVDFLYGNTKDTKSHTKDTK